MLAIVQYPISDFRSMFADRAGRLDAPELRAMHEGRRYPDWLGNYSNKNPEDEFGFIRNFGKFGSRYGGGIMEAPGVFGESNMSDCNRAIRCHVPLQYVDEASKTSTPLWILFRRLYFDGFSTGRIEIGLTNHKMWQEEPPPPVEFNLTALTSVLSKIPLTIHDDRNATQETTLLTANDELALSLLSSTTAHAKRDRAVPDLIGHGFWIGRPSLYVRHSNIERVTLDASLHAQVVREVKSHTIKVVRADEKTSGLLVWIQEYDLGEGATELPVERDIRVLLSRFIAEQQSISHLNEYVAAQGKSLNKQKFTKEYFDRFIEASALSLQGLAGSGNQDGKAMAEAKQVTRLALHGSDQDLLRKLQEMAALRENAKTDKDVMDYLKEGAKFVVETVLKATTELAIKGMLPG
jgi:hypothetical protein